MDTPVETTPLFKFNWSHKGLTENGITLKLKGDGVAPDSRSAGRQINQMLRAKYPTVKWMHRKNIETDTIKYGPTVQLNKTPLRVKPG